MAADFGKLAKEVIPHLGGAENIVGVVHCATRLRFELRDYGKADVEKLKSAYGVISAFHKGGYMQLVIGNKVAECYKVVVAELAGQNVVVADGGAPEQKPKEPMSLGKVGRVIKSLPSRFISTCSAVFTPVMLMIAAAGILWGIFNIFTTAGVDPDGDFATLWGMMADGPL
ncbi:MAG: PTS transporter subunit EIIB, partial [Firmicutes bacterium]|nr:PTS transporter subunit EIIB [Bacillota bacterium]